jgi:hypothetical protein
MKLSFFTLVVITTVFINSAYAKNDVYMPRKRSIKKGDSLKIERGWNVDDKNEKRDETPVNPLDGLFKPLTEDYAMVARYINQGGALGNIPDKGPSE